MTTNPISPEEFKIQQLIRQIGKQAEAHATEMADTHVAYAVRIQELQEKIRALELEATDNVGSDHAPHHVP